MSRGVRRSRKGHVYQAVEECSQRLLDMMAGQERHCDGKKFANEAHRRRGLRKFTEGHVAFLNAAYSAGDYLRQSISREKLDDVKTLLFRPNVRFHRELRNTVDHTERPEYAVSFEVRQAISLRTPSALSHIDLRRAMADGFVTVELELPQVGKGHLTYDRNSLVPEDARRLDAAATELGLNENPSVIFMAARCYEHLLAFISTASDSGWFREY